MAESIDLDRILLVDQALKTAEASYANNPHDADNLVRWGGALMELSQCQRAFDSENMVEGKTISLKEELYEMSPLTRTNGQPWLTAIDKLEEAVSIDPTKHDAFWCLGNAYTSNAFMFTEDDAAQSYFNKASEYFQKAYELEPQNDLYKKSMEMAAKAPELHAEIYKHGLSQHEGEVFIQQAAESGPPVSTSPKSMTKGINDGMHAMLGWIMLGVGIVAWVGFAKSN